MTSIKQLMHHTMLLVGMLLVGNASVAKAATEASAVTRLTATFVVPTCELAVPATVYLGSIKNGVQSYRPFSFQVNCSVPTDTSVYAQAVGSLDTGSINTVLMEGSGAKFWLKDETDNKNITLNGETGEVFCAGSNSRTCTLIPNTLVTPDNTRGETSTTIRFNIRYEA